MRLVVPYTKKEKYPSLPLFFPLNLTEIKRLRNHLFCTFAPENQSDNLNIEIL